MWLLCTLAGCAEPAKAVDVPPAAVAPEPPSEGATRGEQVRAAESERWYELALAWFNKGDFDKAKEAARRAVQVSGENLAARKLLDDIHSIIVGAPQRHPHERDLQLALVGVEQAQIEIAKHVSDGRRYLSAKMYESARREFAAAELKIRALPYDVPALRDLLPEIRAALRP